MPFHYHSRSPRRSTCSRWKIGPHPGWIPGQKRGTESKAQLSPTMHVRHVCIYICIHTYMCVGRERERTKTARPKERTEARKREREETTSKNQAQKKAIPMQKQLGRLRGPGPPSKRRKASLLRDLKSQVRSYKVYQPSQCLGARTGALGAMLACGSFRPEAGQQTLPGCHSLMK